jgi:hypothetical protein
MSGPGPRYNGTDDLNQPNVSPWWTRGFTAQTGTFDTTPATADVVIPNDSIIAEHFGAPPAYPSNLISVDVTGTYFDSDGNMLPGYLTFLMTDNITVQDPSGTYYRMPARYAGRMANGSAFGQNNWGNGRIYIWSGQVEVLLFQTDSSYMTTDSGNPLYWFVQEHYLGGRQYFISCPGTTQSPADINTLIVPGTITPYDYDPISPLGNGTMPSVPAGGF